MTEVGEVFDLRPPDSLLVDGAILIGSAHDQARNRRDPCALQRKQLGGGQSVPAHDARRVDMAPQLHELIAVARALEEDAGESGGHEAVAEFALEFLDHGRCGAGWRHADDHPAAAGGERSPACRGDVAEIRDRLLDAPSGALRDVIGAAVHHEAHRRRRDARGLRDVFQGGATHVVHPGGFLAGDALDPFDTDATPA
ncbi:hypothetical protein Q9R08_00910 [Microbacterium sp. QXD-8]|uniref:Uncharacterized protein n=1 Tax=Microbacterium psychrotolerans TaxID=3068321 RepID=A0ABU0YZ30_9MICO|nr:hypothetical protein [Microbacterium sp. QXD-8]MDQ7876526.1 hypothetical protein [Microbacterium sp. QXD-8]